MLASILVNTILAVIFGTVIGISLWTLITPIAGVGTVLIVLGANIYMCEYLVSKIPKLTKLAIEGLSPSKRWPASTVGISPLFPVEPLYPDMPPAHVDALVETAPDGISFDGLTVESSDDGFTFQTPNATVDGLSEDGLRDLAAGSPFVTNWYFWHAAAPQTDERWAFLRWLEGASTTGDADDAATVPERYERLESGIPTEWGQLRITVSLDGNGGRCYDLRHVDDAETAASDLESHDDPLAARELARLDERGRYRPLKTAPSLAGGWVFPELGPDELVQAVDFFYPATIANWHQEREGTLDVTHWTETTGRQTGIYGIVETWDRGEGHGHAEWVAEACCVDSQCLKRREWEYDEETDLETPAGEAVFPCREPCSLVISATRRFLKTDSEQRRSYEFELTPTEKEQLEEIIDAVADGRVDDIREADTKEGANRYRTRFLRARYFDDDGDLCGVPTDEE